MVKKLFSLFLLSILILSVTGCGNRDASVSNGVSVSEPSSALHSAQSPELPPEMSSGIAPDAGETLDINGDTAVFTLGLHGKDEKTMGIGDSIGDWTLKDLQIQHDEDDHVQMMEALFAGDVELGGVISRSALLEEGYDFQVAREYESKMPYYISPEMGQKDEFWFMLNIPAEIAGSIVLEHGEQRNCKIVISDYRFIFAYMMAPPSATVTSFEMQ